LCDKSDDGLLRLDICCLFTLRSLLDVEGHTLAFVQRLEAFSLNFREAREEVFATVIRCDESKTFASLNHLTVP
jgi:hypothetical protein